MSIVTIRGQLGSGAPEVGRELADRLKGDYVDRQIIAEVAGRLDRKEQEIREKEMPPSSILGRIAEALARGSAFGDAIPGAYLPMEQIPLGDARYLHALEAVIMEHPAVEDCAVVGIPEENLGEIPKAFIVRRDGYRLEPEEIVRFVSERVAPYKKIREVAFIREIPRNLSGKILRRILKVG